MDDSGEPSASKLLYQGDSGATTGGRDANVESTERGGGIGDAVVENVAELKFGPEFEDMHVLSNAQVAMLLTLSAQSAVNRDEELNDVYKKTQKYVDRFNGMANPEKAHQELVDELDNLHSALTTFRKEADDDMGGGNNAANAGDNDNGELELHPAEVAALMNLVATDTSVEEAKALIPSLSRFQESAIDEILDLIRSTMIRIVS